MSKLETLLAEFGACRGAFPYVRLVKLLSGLGYEAMKSSGGSSRRFAHRDTKQLILLHEPHPGKDVKAYKVREIQNLLKTRQQL